LIDHIAASINRHHQKAFLLFITTGILLMSFGMYKLLTPTVRIAWTTESEVDTLGFNLLREDMSDPDNRQQINSQLIIAQGSPISGMTYTFIDRNVEPGKSYIYHLMEIDNSNIIVELESIEIRVKHAGFVEIGIGLVLITMVVLLSISK
jgi:hypothetical protein